jgi:hypothetical protein
MKGVLSDMEISMLFVLIVPDWRSDLALDAECSAQYAARSPGVALLR